MKCNLGSGEKYDPFFYPSSLLYDLKNRRAADGAEKKNITTYSMIYA